MRKIVVIILIMFSVLLLGLGVVGAIMGDTEKVKEPEKPVVDEKPVVPTTKKISCTRSEFGEIYNAMIDTTIDVTFNTSDTIDVFKTTTNYSFNDFNDYNNWKMNFENNNIWVQGVSSSNIFDDTSMVLTNIVEQKYSEMSPENINYEYPTDYEGLKNHFIFGGYNCTEQ